MMRPALPRVLPALSVMLEDLGHPPAAVLAKLLGVSERTVYRWMAADHAPRSPALALYWLTRWGRSARECAADNKASAAAGLVGALTRENAALRAELSRVVSLGQFDTANAPTARDLPAPPGSAALRLVG